MNETDRRIVAVFVKFLQEKLQRNQLAEAQAESVDVAIQCLQQAFGITDSDLQARCTREIFDALIQAVETQPAAPQQTASQQNRGPSEADKAEAERLKNEGNDLMKDEKFQEALEKYSNALEKHKNAIILSNRAAAYSKLEQHEKAIQDCKEALKFDPNYSKAYGRMGLAYSCLNKHRDARDCYKKAVELDPENASFRNNLAIAEQKLADEAAPGAGGAGGIGGGLGAGLGGLGGMPDLMGMLNNPALMNMATQLMSDPQMQNFMGSMMGGAMNAGPTGQQGMNSLLEAGQRLASQMQSQNPDLVEALRRQFQGGGGPHPPQGGGGGGGGAPGSGGGGPNQQPPPGNI